MFIVHAILIAYAVILLFSFKVLFFGKKKSVSRPKPNSYSDQTKTEKVRIGGGVKQNSQFEEKGKPCSNLLKPEKRKEEEKKQKEEEKKHSLDLSKTTPRSYSTTLSGFERIQQRKPSSYSDLLNTEEWRNKRLKIIKRDNCRCTYCGNRFHLHVHHKYYSAYPNGVLVYPWNYPDDALIILCAYCHQRVHARKKIKIYYRRYTDNY